MKTKEKLKELKEQYKTLNNKLKELTEDELKLVTGGVIGEWNNIDHSGINVKNKGNYSINYGITTPTNESTIPLSPDEKLKS